MQARDYTLEIMLTKKQSTYFKNEFYKNEEIESFGQKYASEIIN